MRTLRLCLCRFARNVDRVVRGLAVLAAARPYRFDGFLDSDSFTGGFGVFGAYRDLRRRGGIGGITAFCSGLGVRVWQTRAASKDKRQRQSGKACPQQRICRYSLLRKSIRSEAEQRLTSSIGRLVLCETIHYHTASSAQTDRRECVGADCPCASCAA